ncbi:MAG: DUF6883 domain-containing protein [Acidobacteriota bacterium]
MKMPNCKSAVVDVGKLLDYCLNPAHPRGRHKARVFAISLGLTNANADLLRYALLNSACSDDAIRGELDGYGQRYVVDFTMSTAVGQAVIRSAWMVRRGEDFPRLLSCYVL